MNPFTIPSPSIGHPAVHVRGLHALFVQRVRVPGVGRRGGLVHLLLLRAHRAPARRVAPRGQERADQSGEGCYLLAKGACL